MKKLMVQINKQNTGNIEQVVSVLKAKKDEHAETRTARITKLAKVPSWSKDLSMETYVKQIETWNEINEDVPPNTKCQDFVESLKTNKEIRGLPKFVAEHVLPVLRRKSDQLVQ